MLSQTSIKEIIFAHLLVYVNIIVIQNVLVLAGLYAFSDLENRGNFFLEFLLLISISLVGTLFGLFNSCVINNVNNLLKIGYGASLLIVFGSDTFW
jgi:ABC-2 type transporter